MCTVKLLYEIKSNVRVLIVYGVVAHSSRFDSRSACDLLDCFLSELIDVKAEASVFTRLDEIEARHFFFRPGAGFENTAELGRDMSEDDFSETKSCRSREKENGGESASLQRAARCEASRQAKRRFCFRLRRVLSR